MSAEFERGTPGRSAEAEHRRRLARDEAERRELLGPFAGLAALLAGRRRSTTPWSVGADGERRVGAALERALRTRGVVLHDRRVPGSRANIDHIAVAPSGVWVVDAKQYHGRVERRSVGGWFGSDLRLFVGRHDRSAAIDAVRRQRDAVRRVLRHDFGEEAPPLHAAICVVGAEWGVFARPFCLDGVWVTRPNRLNPMLLSPVRVGGQRAEGVAVVLARRFPVR